MRKLLMLASLIGALVWLVRGKGVPVVEGLPRPGGGREYSLEWVDWPVFWAATRRVAADTRRNVIDVVRVQVEAMQKEGRLPGWVSRLVG